MDGQLPIIRLLIFCRVNKATVNAHEFEYVDKPNGSF